MATARRSTKWAVAVGLAVLALGGTGWVVASATTSSISAPVFSNTAPYGGVSAPAGKAPLPSARVSPPAANVLPNPSDSGLSKSDPQCGGAPSCHLEGIFPGSNTPFSGLVFKVTNEYFGTYNGQDVSIWAGGPVASSASTGNTGNTGNLAVSGGGVRVLVGGGAIGQYLAPGATTALKLTSADASANTVTLKDADGNSYTFDFATDTFS